MHSVKFADDVIVDETIGPPQHQQANNNNNNNNNSDEVEAIKRRRINGLLPKPPRCSYRFIPDTVAWLFAGYGYALGKWPWLFLSVGIIAGLAASSGLFKLRLATDSNNLIDQFLQDDSRYFTDDKLVRSWMDNQQLQQRILRESFSTSVRNSSSRSKREASLCTSQQSWRSESVMVVSKSDRLFSKDILEEILVLNRHVRDILSCSQDDSSPMEARFYCCDSWDLQRLQWELAKTDNNAPSPQLMADFFSTLTYPADKRIPNTPTLFANFFGGVKTADPNNAYNARIVSVKAMLFQYLLPNSDESLELEHSLTRRQLEDEFIDQVFKESPKVGLAFICVILWCLTGVLHSDALTSKPLLGLAGIGCTAFACAAGFGAQFWSGDYFYTYLVAVPLMALAIGLDDMFILLSNWHRTDASMPREERAMLTLQEGGTSIFVTALMTILDFIIGTYTPYPAINTYSNFAIWCLIFDFWMQLTVFMSILVLTDSCEKKSRHSCCCCLTISKRSHTDLTKLSACRLICCTYNASALESDSEKFVKLENIPPNNDKAVQMPASAASKRLAASERFVFEHIAPVILHKWSRLVILFGLIAFLAGSFVVIWSQIHIGFRQEHLANRLSNTYDFSIYSWLYFRDYVNSQQLHVVFNFTTAQFNRNYFAIQKQVSEIAERFEQSHDFIWDRRLNHVPFRDMKLENGVNLTFEEALGVLEEQETASMYRPSLIGDSPDTERIIFLATFQTKDLSSLERGALLAQFIKSIQTSYETGDDFRLIVTDSEQSLRVFDQIVNLPKQLIYFALITLSSTAVVSLLMVPHPICVFWLALSSIYIIIGTIAVMVLCSVSLDPVSLIYLLMAIGATADYICHAIYTFTVIEPLENEGQLIGITAIRYAKARRLISYVVYETGPAIVATLLSVVVLSTANIYVLEAFFKVFSISVVVAFVFMAIVLPVALCQFGPTGEIGIDMKSNDNFTEHNCGDHKVSSTAEASGLQHQTKHGDIRRDVVFVYPALLRSSKPSLKPRKRIASKAVAKLHSNHKKDLDSHWKNKVLNRFLDDSSKYHSSSVDITSQSHSAEPLKEISYVNASLCTYAKTLTRNFSLNGQKPVPETAGCTKKADSFDGLIIHRTASQDRIQPGRPKQFQKKLQTKRNGPQHFKLPGHGFEESTLINLHRPGVRPGILNH